MDTESGFSYEKIICPATDRYPRNGEGDVVQLSDGSLLLAYTEFYGGHGDFSQALIASKTSTDGGLSWRDHKVLQPNIGRVNVMSASIERLHSGELGLVFLVKNGEHDCKAYFRRSKDEGRTWSDPVCATPEEGYHVVNNDRLVQLRSGRLLIPACSYPNGCGKDPKWANVFYSDDGGESWQLSDSRLAVEGSQSGMQEPGVAELPDGSLLMFMRCDLGYIYYSRSKDEGVTWTSPKPTSLVAPVSPCTLKRIPGTDDLLVIWNNRENHPASEPFQRRTPLTAAVSEDGGETWINVRDIEADRSRTYCYTSATFVGERVILTYYVSEQKPEGERVLASLKLKILDLDWFYGGE